MDMRQRINFYIDGFNFYHRIRNFLDETEVDYRWLDYRALCESLLKPHETLGQVFFFTAVPRHLDKRKVARHLTLLRALKSRGVRVVEGKFRYRKEKMTDVAIASQMLADAYEDRFDTCFLISSDSDFVPAVRMVQRRAHKRVGLIVPPHHGEMTSMHSTGELRKSVSVSAKKAPLVRSLKFTDLNGCGLPPVLLMQGGKRIRKPSEYALFHNGPPPGAEVLIRTTGR